jgi:hypothetical protein
MRVSKTDQQCIQKKVDLSLLIKAVDPQRTVKINDMPGIIFSEKRSNAKNRSNQKKPDNIEQSLVFSCNIIIAQKEYKYVTFESQEIRDTYLKSTINAEVFA